MRRLASLCAALCALAVVAPVAAADDICTRAGFATDGTSTLTRFGTAGGTTTATFAGTALGRPAVTPDGTKVYVPDTNGDRLVVARGGDGADTTTRIAVGAGPSKVLIAPSGVRAYVLNADASTISIVDVAADRVVATTPAFAHPLLDIALNADGSTLYGLSGDGTQVDLHALPTAGDSTVASTLPVSGTQEAQRLAVAGTRIVLTVSDRSDIPRNTVATVSTAGGAITRSTTVTLAGPADDLLLSPDGATAYVSSGGTRLTTIAVATLTSLASATRTALYGLAPAPGGAVYAGEGTAVGIYSSGGTRTGQLAVAARQLAVCTSTATRPGVPAGVTVRRGDQAITAAWTPPASDGGAAITAYEAVASPGDATCTASTAANCTITGLVNGRSYTIKVRARNAVGWGDLSLASIGIQPRRDTSAQALPVDGIIVRTTKKAVIVTSRVNAPSAGMVAQTITIRGKRYGATSKQVAGGVLLLRCVLKPSARAMVRRSRVTTLQVRTTFTPFLGVLASDRQDVPVTRRR